MTRMDEVDQNYGIQDKHYREMKQTCREVMEELRSNQAEQKKQSQRLINEIWQLASKMDDHVNDIDEKLEKHREQLGFQDHLLSDHSNRITAQAGRIFDAET